MLIIKEINDNTIYLTKCNNRMVNIPVFWIVLSWRFLYKFQILKKSVVSIFIAVQTSLLQLPKEAVKKLVSW
jgi:hypothetical protein